MDQEELQRALKANEELNSPEAQTANAELRTYLEQQKQMAAEPLEATLHIPYTDTANFDEKLSQIEQLLQEMRETQKAEQVANIESEKNSEKRDKRTFVIAVLTLIATIVTVGIGIITLLLQFHQ